MYNIQQRYNNLKKNNFVIQSFNTIILRVIGIVTLFGFTLFLTHNYRPEIIGQYDFIRTYLLVIGSICLLGTDQSILYFAGIINGNNTDLKEVYIKMFKIVFFMSLFILFIFLLIGKQTINGFFNDGNVYLLLLKSTIVIFFYCITLLNTEMFRALNKVYSAELFRNTFKYASVILGSIILLYFGKMEYLVDSFLIGFIFLSIISTLMILKLLKNNLITKSVVFSNKEIVLKSYPMAISGMCFFLMMSFDVFFIKKYAGNHSVAYYSLALKLMNVITMIILSVNISVSSEIAEHYKSNNMIALKRTLKKSTRLIFFMTLPIVIIICVFSKTILGFFGKEYILAVNSLILMMVGQGISSAFGPSPVYLNMTGRGKTYQYILIIALVLDFILNLLLTPIYGILGTSIAFIASSLFWIITVTVTIYIKDKIIIFIH